MVSRFSHNGPIYKHDNKSVYINIKKAAMGTSVESTTKEFSLRKDDRGEFLYLISNHTGDNKYREIFKKCINLL